MLILMTICKAAAHLLKVTIEAYSKGSIGVKKALQALQMRHNVKTHNCQHNGPCSASKLGSYLVHIVMKAHDDNQQS